TPITPAPFLDPVPCHKKTFRLRSLERSPSQMFTTITRTLMNQHHITRRPSQHSETLRTATPHGLSIHPRLWRMTHPRGDRCRHPTNSPTARPRRSLPHPCLHSTSPIRLQRMPTQMQDYLSAGPMAPSRSRQAPTHGKFLIIWALARGRLDLGLVRIRGR
ncbi:hypothetical protein DXG03_006275, partial [Asterophora parasitica]